MNFRRMLAGIGLVVGAFLFSIGLQTFAATYTPPTAAPPNANAEAPLNTGNQAQEKSGGLLLNTGGAKNGLIVQNGNVGIGVMSPTKKLDVLGDISATGDICTSSSGGICLTSVIQKATGAGPLLYTQAAGCPLGGSVTTVGSCTTSVGTSLPPDGYYGGGYYTYDCAGGYVDLGSVYYYSGTPSGYTCLNNAIGSLMKGGINDNTVTIYHPTVNETKSCSMNVAGMNITITAAYNASTARYAVSGPWVSTTLPVGGSTQGCYPAGGCGEAQTNISIGDSVSTVRARNGSGGVTTTTTHNVYVSGSFWLSNGRGSGSCSAYFTS